MTGEEIGREKKAKRYAREVLRSMIQVLREADDRMWHDLGIRVGLPDPSDKTKARIIELLEGIAL